MPYLYSVGQPMGALSSWGMLALTHHVLVQVAAKRVGHITRFTDYAILGDDLVIANKAVAQAYLALASEFGLVINQSKSLESEIAVLEFAKRLFISTEDASPLPPKLVSQLLYGTQYLPSILRDMMDRGLTELNNLFSTKSKPVSDSIL